MKHTENAFRDFDKAEQQGKDTVRKYPRIDMTSMEFSALLDMDAEDAIVKAFYAGVGIGVRSARSHRKA